MPKKKSMKRTQSRLRGLRDCAPPAAVVAIVVWLAGCAAVGTDEFESVTKSTTNCDLSCKASEDVLREADEQFNQLERQISQLANTLQAQRDRPGANGSCSWSTANNVLPLTDEVAAALCQHGGPLIAWHGDYFESYPEPGPSKRCVPVGMLNTPGTYFGISQQTDPDKYHAVNGLISRTQRALAHALRILTPQETPPVVGRPEIQVIDANLADVAKLVQEGERLLPQTIGQYPPSPRTATHLASTDLNLEQWANMVYAREQPVLRENTGADKSDAIIAISPRVWDVSFRVSGLRVAGWNGTQCETRESLDIRFRLYLRWTNQCGTPGVYHPYKPFEQAAQLPYFPPKPSRMGCIAWSTAGSNLAQQ